MALIHPMSIEPDRASPRPHTTDEPGTRPDAERVASMRAVLARCALALTRREHDADDLVQDTLARLIERRPDMTNHEGYAVATMTRLWLTRQRRAAAHARRLRAIASERIGLPVGSSRSLDRIERIVAGLPPRQRAVLVLRAVMDLTIPQIADALDIDPKTVRSNLHLARQRVRRDSGDPA